MKRFLYLVFIVLILGGAAWLLADFFLTDDSFVWPETGDRPAKTVSPFGDSGSAVYTNPVYRVSLRYPASWRADERYGTIGGNDLAVRFGGEGGFFGVDALGSGDEPLEDVVRSVAYHRLMPYGENPTILETRIAGREAAFILPSEDQPASSQDEAVLLVRYPEPVRVELVPGNPEMFAFFALYAPEDQIRQIASTLEFID